MEFILRDFQRGDFQTLWTIDQKCFPPGISYSRLELAAYMRRPGSFTLVAESGESSSSVLGFIVAEARRNGAGHVITIDVLVEARRFGIGSRLLTAAEERLQTARCRNLRLETAVDNIAALTFYKRHNYHVVKTIPRYYSNGVDAFVLQKDLPSGTEAMS
jgi:ribosomal-protein-alanine N-acetyltransferase